MTGPRNFGPAEVHKLLRAQLGTRLVWPVMPGGVITVRVNCSQILGMSGMREA